MLLNPYIKQERFSSGRSFSSLPSPPRLEAAYLHTMHVFVCVNLQAMAELAYQAGLHEDVLPVVTASHESSPMVGKVCHYNLVFTS